MSPFVRTEDNDEVFELFEHVDERAGKILLVGLKGSGKSTFLKNYATQSNRVAADRVLYCSGVEIYAAIFIRENEKFLSKLGEAPIVVIDDVEQLVEKDKGDEVLKLLINARDEAGLATVLVSNLSSEDLAGMLPAGFIDGYRITAMHPLTADDGETIVSTMDGFYRTEDSPVLDESAVSEIIAECDGVKEIERAVHYLMTESGRSASDTMTADDVRTLLSS